MRANHDITSCKERNLTSFAEMSMLTTAPEEYSVMHRIKSLIAPILAAALPECTHSITTSAVAWKACHSLASVCTTFSSCMSVTYIERKVHYLTAWRNFLAKIMHPEGILERQHLFCLYMSSLWWSRQLASAPSMLEGILMVLIMHAIYQQQFRVCCCLPIRCQLVTTVS